LPGLLDSLQSAPVESLRATRRAKLGRVIPRERVRQYIDACWQPPRPAENVAMMVARSISRNVAGVSIRQAGSEK